MRILAELLTFVTGVNNNHRVRTYVNHRWRNISRLPASIRRGRGSVTTTTNPKIRSVNLSDGNNKGRNGVTTVTGAVNRSNVAEIMLSRIA